MSLRIRRGGAATSTPPPPSGGGYTFPTTSYVFPQMSGVVDVSTFGANGVATVDQTTAIQNAINANLNDHTTASKIIWFPGTASNPKTYLVSSRIVKGGTSNWRGDFWLQGESEEGVTIKLADNTAAFASTTTPRAVLFQSSYALTGGTPTWAAEGTGAEGFRNFIADMTIDLGSGNPGACGIDTMTHNLGSVRRVTIDGTSSGFAGILATRPWPGPCLFHRITVNGCDYGFYVGQPQYGFTIEHLKLTNQTTAGIRLDKNQLHIRGIESTNSVPVIDIIPGTTPPSNPTTLPGVSVIDASLTGGSASVSAIQNRSASGKIYLRRVSTSGYRAAADEGSTPATSTSVTEYATPPTNTLISGAPTTGLNLTINDTPDSQYPALAAMTNAATLVPALSSVTTAGDQSANIQLAIDNCTTAGLYFPSNAGRWNLSGVNSITIRGNVRHLMFNGGDFFITGTGYTSKPIFIIASTMGGNLVIEHARLDRAGQTVSRMWDNRSSYNVTFKDCYVSGYLTGAADLGELYVDDVIASGFTMNISQNMWARQFNAEHTTGITKTASGDVWILGWKTEYENQSGAFSGGRTELIGMFTYPDPDGNSIVGTTTFTVSNCAMSIANLLSYSFTADYTNFVTETQGASSASLATASLNDRGSQGHWISLYRSKL